MTIRSDTHQAAIEPGVNPAVVASLDGLERAVIEDMRTGVVLSDDTGVVTYANAESARIFQMAKDDLVGRRISELLPLTLSEPEAATDPHGQAQATGATREVRLKLREGADLWVEVAARQLSNGPQSHVLTTVCDITERRDIDFALKRIVFDQAPYGLLLIDGDGVIMSSNEPLNRIFGYQPGEVQGKNVEMLVPARFREGHFAQRSAFATSPLARSMGKGRDVTGRRKDGREVPVEIGLSPFMTSAGRMICAYVVDITERERVERKLREANAKLEEFANAVAHDLRSPLRGIANLIDFIVEDFGESAPRPAIRNLDRMRDRVQNAESMIADLLSYARANQESAKFETIDLAAVVEEVFAAEPASPGLHFETKLTSEPFEGARSPLWTVLRNLVSNAVKHHDRKDIHVVVKSRNQGDFVAIDVCDDGPGIPEAAQSRVFRLFQTLSGPDKKGSGLGLALTQRLVSSHGGRIELISFDGRRGCTFRVWWPRFIRSDLDE